VDLYVHSPIRLHGVVLNYLGTGTTLPTFAFILNNHNVTHFIMYSMYCNIHTTELHRTRPVLNELQKHKMYIIFQFRNFVVFISKLNFTCC
jgi:hypothetical protein